VTPDPKTTTQTPAASDAAQALRDVLLQLAELGRKRREQKKAGADDQRQS
jgi:hypothetical protein